MVSLRDALPSMGTHRVAVSAITSICSASPSTGCRAPDHFPPTSRGSRRAAPSRCPRRRPVNALETCLPQRAGHGGEPREQARASSASASASAAAAATRATLRPAGGSFDGGLPPALRISKVTARSAPAGARGAGGRARSGSRPRARPPSRTRKGRARPGWAAIISGPPRGGPAARARCSGGVVKGGHAPPNVRGRWSGAARCSLTPALLLAPRRCTGSSMPRKGNDPRTPPVGRRSAVRPSPCSSVPSSAERTRRGVELAPVAVGQLNDEDRARRRQAGGRLERDVAPAERQVQVADAERHALGSV